VEAVRAAGVTTSTAVSDPSGTVWMGTGYISGIERTFYANWATYIAHVTP
jgi:hypothetical protein